MLEETRQTTRFDPSTSHHRPASGKSQDISHVLAGIFKDLYTRDAGKEVVSNLTKTRPGGGSFQDRYVEELQQAHREYTECIKEADMLEAHIIEARAQAAAKESEALKKMKQELGDEDLVVNYEGLLTVKSLFSWCVDGNLLKRKGLISPQDYLTSPKTPMKAPKAVKQNPARPTFVSTMRATREGGGGTLPTRCPENIPSDSESECMTQDSTSCISNVKETPNKSTKPRSTWKEKPDADEGGADGFKKLPKLRLTQNFLHNPRFLPPSARRGGSSLIRSKVSKTEQGEKGTNKQGLDDDDDDPVPVFLPNPPILLFSEYSVGDVYEITLELENMTSSCRNIRVTPPSTPYFSMSLERFPGDGTVVAPGMSCKYAVRFAPDSLGEYEDFIVVETQAEQKLVVPIRAHRPPPVLTLPNVLDCGYCLIGGVKFVEFRCQNVGLSPGTFCVIPKNQWPPSNLRSVGRTYFSEQPPFAVSPSVFGLQPGEATVVDVVFFPTTTEEISQVFTLVCDNCQVKDISVRGEGQRIALELVSGENTPVAGDVLNLAADHFVHVGPCNPQSVQQKAFVIRNNVHLELPFTWQIIKPGLHTPLPGEDVSHVHFHLARDDIFHISPQAGVLAPCQDQEFLLTFCPKELQDYHSVCHLVLRDTPQLPPEEPCDEGVLQPVRAGSKVSDVIAMEIEVKGSTEPYQVLLEPYAIIIPGELYVFTTTRKRFTMWNYSKTHIFFHWERLIGCHIIEVAPSTGRIEVNEGFDFELMVTGGKPERVAARLDCHIEHHHELVSLALEVSFKGSIVTVNVPSLDFGLMRLGDQTTATLVLTNTAHLEASWTLEEVHKSHRDRQIRMKPTSGVLPPLANCSVDVLFTPHFCQKLETELELTVKNGTGCHLSVRGDVQSPEVSLLNSTLDLTDLYPGISAEGSVTLVNHTKLPSNFSWKAQLQGQQAPLCAATFEPSSGTLGPSDSAEVRVHVTAHTELELSDVAALCEVEGMNSPLVLHITVSRTKTLRVSYSLPGVCRPPDDQSSSALVLDFGDDVTLKSPVVRQIVLTNETPIPSSFSIEVEFFTCRELKPSKQPGQRLAHTKKPLHSFQAKKVEEKARTDFVNNLLANGKGAAFLVQPSTGPLGAWETRTVEVTAYSDMWGEYRDHLICKVGDLAPTLVPMQMAVKGCPLYFQIIGPRPDNQNQGPDIRFGTHLSGDDTVSRSLRINNPTMFDIRIDWETYNIDANDRRLVDVLVIYGKAFPIKDEDGNEILGEAPRPRSTNVQTAAESSASLHSVTDSEGNDCDADLCPNKLFSVVIRPHVGNLSDYPFCITPQQIVIPAKSSRTIHASFTPLNLPEPACESSCTGLALGFMSLDSETASCVEGKVTRAQGLDVDPIRMDLQAAVTPAVLSVLMEEGHGVLEFHASAGELLRSETDEQLCEFDVVQTFQLKNQSERELSFRLETPPPFTVLKQHPHAPTDPSSSQSARQSPFLILQPYRNTQVKVAFHCSPTLLEHADKADEDVPPGVTFIHSAGGRRQLMFQQNLLIHFSNSSLQAVPLRARLTLPSLSLSADTIDFGSCVAGQTQTKDLTLYSRGCRTYWKSLIESDEEDPGAFAVTPTSGFLTSREHHVSSYSRRLQISFTASENRQFKATVVIWSPLVKTPLLLQLQGTGSPGENQV